MVRFEDDLCPSVSKLLTRFVWTSKSSSTGADQENLLKGLHLNVCTIYLSDDLLLERQTMGGANCSKYTRCNRFDSCVVLQAAKWILLSVLPLQAAQPAVAIHSFLIV